MAEKDSVISASLLEKFRENLVNYVDVPEHLDLGFDELHVWSSVTAPPPTVTIEEDETAPPPTSATTNEDEAAPPTKKPKRRHFLKPLSAVELEEKSRKFVPIHTARQNRWAIGLFKSWLASRNAVQKSFPDDILEVSHPLDTLQSCLLSCICL